MKARRRRSIKHIPVKVEAEPSSDSDYQPDSQDEEDDLQLKQEPTEQQPKQKHEQQQSLPPAKLLLPLHAAPMIQVKREITSSAISFGSPSSLSASSSSSSSSSIWRVKNEDIFQPSAFDPNDIVFLDDSESEKVNEPEFTPQVAIHPADLLELDDEQEEDMFQEEMQRQRREEDDAGLFDEDAEEDDYLDDGDEVMTANGIAVKNEGFPCKKCDKEFSTLGRLTKHDLLTHDQETSFVCNWVGCDRTYMRREHLSRHIQQVHTGERPFPCLFTGCPYDFVTKQQRDQHLRAHTPVNVRRKAKNQARRIASITIEEPDDSDIQKIAFEVEKKSFPCEQCGLVLACQDDYLDHCFEVHLGESIFVCLTCGEGFSKMHKLNAHVQAKHAGGKYACRQLGCNQAYRNVKDYRLHMQHDHLLAVCKAAGCDCSFVNKPGLDAHIRDCHPAIWEKQGCDLCGRRFIGKGALAGHIARMHSGIVKFPCEIPGCGRLFRTLETAKSHGVYHRKILTRKKAAAEHKKFLQKLREDVVQQRRRQRYEIVRAKRAASMESQRRRKLASDLRKRLEKARQASKSKVKPKSFIAKIAGLKQQEFRSLMQSASSEPLRAIPPPPAQSYIKIDSS